MSQQHRFRAVIEEAGGGGAFVTVPFDVEQAFGSKRVPVCATIDGEPYRGTLVRMGGDCHMLIVLKEIRQRIGKQPGDEVEVMVQVDREPRVVEVPAELRVALRSNPQAQSFFDALAFTHQREYVRWIAEAKREQTRAARITRTVEMLTSGKKPR
jgi:bifunctional DNA-binding transcriptional regulator/antitoxin component of YhaV-PrlF toxin-antitoxin module